MRAWRAGLAVGAAREAKGEPHTAVRGLGSPCGDLPFSAFGITFIPVSTVTEIEAAIEKLPSADFSELLAWIEDYRAMISGSETLFAMYDDEEEQSVAES